MNDQSLAGTNPQIPSINSNNTNKSPNPAAMLEAFLPFRPLLPSADSLPSFPSMYGIVSGASPERARLYPYQKSRETFLYIHERERDVELCRILR